MSITACCCLLLLQLSGMHVHADAAGFLGTPETSYAHTSAHTLGHDAHDSVHGTHTHAGSGPAHSDSDHSDDHGQLRDISLLETVLGTFKLPFAIIAPVLPFGVLPQIKTLATAEIAHPSLNRRHIHWRPPLRAPPRTA